MPPAFRAFHAILAISVFLATSTVHAGAVVNHEEEYCVYGTGNGSTATWSVPYTGAGGASGCSGTVTIPVAATSAEIVDLLISEIDGCQSIVRAHPEVTPCPLTSPPSVGFLVRTLMFPFTLALDGNTVSPGVPVVFNPVVFVPEPTTGALLFAGVGGLLALGRKRRR